MHDWVVHTLISTPSHCRTRVPRRFLVGTEDGFIHKCSLDYSGAYLASFPGHKMAVYAVRWNAFHPRVFLSSSAGTCV